MNAIINGLNVVIAELNLVVANAANGDTNAHIKAAIIKAQADLQAVLDKVIAQGSGGDENPNP